MIGFLKEEDLPEDGNCCLSRGLTEDGNVYVQVTQSNKNFASIILTPEGATEVASDLLKFFWKSKNVEHPAITGFLTDLDKLKEKYGIGTFAIAVKDPDTDNFIEDFGGHKSWVYGHLVLLADRIRQEVNNGPQEVEE